jgi:hypothetical protein
MNHDNRPTRNSSQPASSTRSISGSPKRFLRKILLLSLLTVGAASSAVRVVHAGVSGSVITVHNLSNNYIEVHAFEAGRQTSVTGLHAREIERVISHRDLSGAVTCRVTDINGIVLAERTFPTNAPDTDWNYDESGN